MRRLLLYATTLAVLLMTGFSVRAEISAHRTDATTVPSMPMGDHMQVSVKTAAQPGDAARAAHIEAIARTIVAQYRDPATAVRAGYQPFFDSGTMGSEIHYVNMQYTAEERAHIDYEHPGAILYKRTPQGLVAVGVMYSAEQDADSAELNARLPLSISPWHRHVDICKARGVPLTAQVQRDSKFGFRGSIHSQDACKQADGQWLPVVFGWMTHVYPNAPDQAQVWGGTDMQMAGMKQ